MERLRNFIAGEWAAPRTGSYGPSRNPARPSEVLCEVPLSGPDDVQAAIAAARAALPGWRATPAPRRGELLFRALRLFEERVATIARALSAEEGKTLGEATGEVKKGLNVLEYMAGEGRRIGGETTPSELPST